jgi:hypothetical protein
MTFLFKKQNGDLLFKDCGGYETRNISTMWCIHQANLIYQWKDFPEIQVDTHDNYDGEGYSYIKKNGNKLVPDFVFHAWPEVGIHDYETFVNQVHHAGKKPYRIHKVGWIGNPDTNPMRKTMIEMGKAYPHMFDLMEMKWIPSGKIELDSTKYVSTPDLVETYSMLIDIEGAGPYSARLKTLLWSHRPLLLVDRPGKEFFFTHLKEWVHYIPIKRDLSDLIEKTKWCFDNYDKALAIGENAFMFSQLYLTRTYCYSEWNRIIHPLQAGE